MPSGGIVDELDAQLRNWAAWAKSDAMPKLDFAEPPIFAEWIPKNGWESGWGDAEAIPASPHPCIDDRAAEALDKLLLRLRVRYWHTLRRHYYLARHVDELTLGESLRALGDLMARHETA